MVNGTSELIAALCIIMVGAALLPLILLGVIYRPVSKTA
jgi:hypothetical protein